MILQYYANCGEVYSESENVGLYVVDVSEMQDKTSENLINRLVAEVPACRGTTIIDINDILDDKNTNVFKLAVLSDGKERKNNKTLLFDDNVSVYLLNNEGKTIKKL